ncbi:MAG TPA: zf-HC2 domain-containing protein [Thermoanaerobaculia bacterium]|jgi:hypothetical protein|nr:zf-HC2 domain-containing protein [Thermoanaerobaculia bacterium]
MTDDRELVVRALRQLAEAARKGQEPDAHPAVEEIIAYHAGELPAEPHQALQRHLLGCRDCPELILALDGFANLPDGEPGAPPAGIDSAWEEVRRRLAAEGWFAGGRARPSRWAAPRYLLAAAAIVVLASLSFVLLHVPADRQPRIVDHPEPGVPLRDLGPAVRGPVQEIAVPKTAERFLLAATPEGPSYPEYRVELRDASVPGRLLWFWPWHPRPGSPDLFLQVPRGFLSPGEYRLRLIGLEGGRPAPVPDERRFRLSFR